MKSNGRHLPSALLLGLVLLLGACNPTPEHAFGGSPIDPPGPPPRITATNWDGEAFDLRQLEGRAAIVFFGYTWCPDVCPMTLAKMKQLYGELGEDASQLAVVFITVDPKRDTVEKLASYVPNFDPRFFGLRPDDDELAEIEEAFDLTIQFGQPKDGPGTDSYYYVDHTGTYFLLDRQHRPRVELPPNATVEEMLPDVRYLLSE